MTHTPLQITKTLLKPWSPCSDGYRWFLDKFPEGAEFTAVQKALREEKRFNDVSWLTEKVWSNLILEKPSVVLDATADHKAEALEIIAETKASALEILAETKASALEIIAETKASALEVPTAEELGTTTPKATSDGGKADSQIGASGDYTRIGASGHSARIGASGHSARINAQGERSVIACAGENSTARAGDNGVMALSWFDEATKRTRIAVGYVGEDLKAGTWYSVRHGKFVEVAL